MMIRKIVLYSCLCCCLLALVTLLPKNLPLFAGKSENNLSALDVLLARMQADSDTYQRGIYVPGEFAFPIIQQPEGENLFVSAKRNLVTAFRAAEQNGITGLLAHNFLAGALFYNLEIGQEIWLVESEEKMQGYQIIDIEQFKKIDGDRVDTFIDQDTQASMSGSEVFDRFYTGEPHLILQTCLEGEGDLSWGLTFIVAEPIP